MSSEATLCQAEEPPETVGADGSVRSIRTAACVHADVRLVLSIERNSTSVSPSAATTSAAPATGADQVAPPSVELRYSNPATPEPRASTLPDAINVVPAMFSQPAVAPATKGAVGIVRSSRTVLSASGITGAHPEAFPAASTAWN